MFCLNKNLVPLLVFPDLEDKTQCRTNLRMNSQIETAMIKQFQIRRFLKIPHFGKYPHTDINVYFEK